MEPKSLIEPGLYLIINLDWHLRDRRPPLEFCRKVLRGGCSAVQLRFKDVFDSIVLEVAKDLRKTTKKSNVPLIINDRPDIALLSGADGVHVGQEDLSPLAVSGLVPGLVVGLSTHTAEQVGKAQRRHVGYIGFGPVFGTRSKKSLYPVTGPGRLRGAAEISRVPVVAIGGIDERTCEEVVGAGVRRAAVLSALYGCKDPRSTAKAIHKMLLE